jgi:hypothetical protein
VGTWIRSKLVLVLAFFLGFEVTAWFVSKIVPAVHAYLTFFGATVFGTTMLGVYLLVTRRPATTDNRPAPTGTAQSGTLWRGQKLFPELRADIPESSVCLESRVGARCGQTR